MPAPPCKPGCRCGKHFHSELHNEFIARALRFAYYNVRDSDGRFTKKEVKT